MTETEKKIKDLLLHGTYYESESDGDFVYRVDIDRREGLPKETLKQIFTSTHPNEAFIDVMGDIILESSDYQSDYIVDKITSKDDSISREEILDYLRERCSFECDPEDFNQDLKVNMRINVGDANADFIANNALNYYSDWSTRVDEKSSIYWLAKQMGKEKLLQEEIDKMYSNSDASDASERTSASDTFVESVVQELENNCCGNSALTFLFTMKFLDLIKLREDLLDPNNSNKTITIPKNTMCGLYDSFAGGGSVLEIELDKDLEIPYSLIFDVWPDGAGDVRWDVNDVYGLTSQCWGARVAV